MSNKTTTVPVRLLKDSIREALAAKGITEAQSVEVTDVNSGASMIIVSADNPALNQPAANYRDIRPRASATAGAEVRIAGIAL